jgi:hypothetical protein
MVQIGLYGSLSPVILPWLKIFHNVFFFLKFGKHTSQFSLKKILKDMFCDRNKALLLFFVKVHRMNAFQVLAEKCSQLHSIML